jgi:Flp pilus assembly protein TadD
MLSDSLASYLKAIEVDPMNEYALSNAGVIYLKRQDYENCLLYT